jgi:hypothetical protein
VLLPWKDIASQPAEAGANHPPTTPGQRLSLLLLSHSGGEKGRNRALQYLYISLILRHLTIPQILPPRLRNNGRENNVLP